MKTKIFLRDFSIIFVITFIISLIVTYLYSLIAHEIGIVDWATAFRLAVTFGVLFPTMSLLEKRQKK